MIRNAHPLALVAALALGLTTAACGGGAPPPEPQPEQPPPAPAPDTTAERAAREAEEARRRAAAEAARRAERERVLNVIAERVHFDFDKSDIRADQEPVLQRKLAVLREYGDVALQVEGHCDERGSNEYNLALGQRRAESMKRYLSSYGIDAARFTTISYGEERPVAMGHDEDSWWQNRRSEFVVTAYGRLGPSD